MSELLKMPLYRSLHCEERIHCATCRTDEAWREQHVAHYGGPRDYACPLDVSWPEGFTPTDIQVAMTVSVRPSAPHREARPVDPAVIEQQRIEREAKESAALPSAWERVVKGSIGLAKVALGVDRSTDALIESRKAICEECPWLTGSTCQKCGCLYRAKIRLASEECPINKW